MRVPGRKRLLVAALCLLVVGAALAGWQLHRATDTTRVDDIAAPDQLDLRSGDIIVAGGVSLQSRLVRQLTDNSRYSHVGMIEATPAGLFVIHAAPKGEGDGGVGGKVGRIPLDLFLTERGYVTIKVMRLSAERAAADQVAKDACAYAVRCAQQDIPFDAKFDLEEQERMYCSELIYLAYQRAGYDWPDTLVADVSTLIVDGPLITPDAFVDCDDFETVWEYQPPEETAPRNQS